MGEIRRTDPKLWASQELQYQRPAARADIPPIAKGSSLQNERPESTRPRGPSRFILCRVWLGEVWFREVCLCEPRFYCTSLSFW
jgi:hypothetical protein